MRCRGRSILLRGVVAAVLGLGFAVAESGSLTTNGAEAATATATGVEGMTPIDPIRIFETRAGLPGFVGRGVLAAGETAVVPVASALGVASTDIAAVSLNVTVTEPRAAGFLTVWPQGIRPTASTVNFVPGQTVPNGVVVALGADGAIRVFNSITGPAHVIIDLSGWIPINAGFTGITPVRVLETRPGEPGGGVRGALAAGEARPVAVVSQLAGVPAGRRVTAVTANVTTAGSLLPGFLTLYRSGSSLPGTSTLNFRAGQVIANSAVVGVGPDGGLLLFSLVGGTHAVIDITGYFLDDLSFSPMSPRRLADTRLTGSEVMVRVDCSSRVGSTLKGPGPLAAGACYRFDVSTPAGLQPGRVGMVALNVTVAQARRDGYLTIWPSTAVRPATSNSNFVAGEIVANTVLVGALDSIIIQNASAGATDIVVDISGWFPQDALGLVADARSARQNSRGTDVLGVTICHPAGAPAYDVGIIMNRLINDVAAYYGRLSANRYLPTFQLLGEVVQQPERGDFADCDVPQAGIAIPNTIFGTVEVRPRIARANAYGQAGPGRGCLDVACARHPYNATFRGSLFTSVTVADTAPYFSFVLHEFGHTLSWPHSYSGMGRSCPGLGPAPSPYDNPLDIMSGTATGCERAPLDQGQGTIAFNRYAAGWIPIERVSRHLGGTRRYVVGINGAGAAEIVVVPGDDPLAFTTIEARPKSGDDSILLQGGLAFHRIDQRPAVGCSSATRCSGLERRQQQFPPTPDRGVIAHPDYFDGILDGAGQEIDLGGVTVRVVSVNSGAFTIDVIGSVASFGPQPRIRTAGASPGADGMPGDGTSGDAMSPVSANSFYCGVA